MARKKTKNSGGTGIIFVCALALGAILSVPRNAWIAIGVIACVVAVFWWLVSRVKRQSRQLSTSLESTRRREQQGAGVTFSARGVSKSHMDADDNAEFYTVELGSTSSRTFKIPDASSQKPDARWVPEGEAVSVSGFSLPRGMLYVGSSLGGRNDAQEPSLINPKLRIAKAPVDIEERLMSYWPSFHSISPEARRGYLQWLEAGGWTQ